jgi:hypothetical protein
METMARMRWNAQRIMLAIFLTLLAPIVYIYAFNGLFGAGIAYTVDNWLRVFVVSILSLILFVAFELLAYGFGKVISPVGAVLALVGIVLIPLFFIFAFNLIMNSLIPYTVVSYFLVAVVLIAVWLGSALAWYYGS